MQSYTAVTNTGRKIEVEARSYNGAWRKADTLAGGEWIVEMGFKKV